ncbi:UNVERIFIED_CONTAM: hypothetical protein FKN15_072688 [Acipenser sinensis]
MVTIHYSRSKKDSQRAQNSSQASTGNCYSLRKKLRILYEEIDEPNDDDYLYCEDCQTFFIDVCGLHGPALFIADTAAEVGLAHRARLTTPQGMSIRVSKIPNAGLGAWNERGVIPRGAHFGPYQGGVTREEEAVLSGYSWVVGYLSLYWVESSADIHGW